MTVGRVEMNTEKENIEKAFSEIESRTLQLSPGILDLLRVYGDCEAALQQAEFYLQATIPQPLISAVSNTCQEAVEA